MRLLSVGEDKGHKKNNIKKIDCNVDIFEFVKILRIKLLEKRLENNILQVMSTWSKKSKCWE